MEHPNEIEQRLTELEIKASFTEDLLDQLNQTIFHQQQKIDQLVRAISQLQQRSPEESGSGARSVRDELPPHY
jgi:SlyX protein